MKSPCTQIKFATAYADQNDRDPAVLKTAARQKRLNVHKEKDNELGVSRPPPGIPLTPLGAGEVTGGRNGALNAFLFAQTERLFLIARTELRGNSPRRPWRAARRYSPVEPAAPRKATPALTIAGASPRFRYGGDALVIGPRLVVRLGL